jgi:predicted Zn finger-like uncharacterized protein
MILTCPDCATSYFVDDAKIGPDGRAVRCASCGTRWTATREHEPDLELVADPEQGAFAREAAEPEAPPVEALAGEELPKVFRARAHSDKKVRQAATQGVIWGAVAATLAVIIALAIVFRADVVRMWPRSATAFAAVGMPVNNLGLVLEGVKAEPALQGGHAALAVSGQIRNIQQAAVTSPPLKISLLNKAGKPLVTQVAHAADPRIPPGETRHFAISLLDPPSAAHDLEVTFAPMDKAQGGKAPAAKAKASDGHHPPAQTAVPAGLRPAAPAVEATPIPAGQPFALEEHR